VTASEIEGKVRRERCPCCDAPIDEASPYPRYAHPDWPMLRCASCDAIYLEYVPVFSRLVDELAWTQQRERNWERRFKEEPIMARLDKWTLWRLGLFGDPSPAGGIKAWAKPGPVLDVGCSIGASFAKLPAQYTPFGIEIERNAANAARQSFEPRGGKVINSDGVSGLAQLPGAFFTGVSLWGYLEHEARPREALEGVRRVIKPDGIVVIKLPNFDCWNRSVMGRKWTGFWHPDHVQYFTPAVLERMAKKCGFTAKFRLYGQIPVNDYMYANLTPA
jgi:SAM-dependent methyltransferase